ncbi:MAG: ABC transporter ATP-binding protein, partial [Archangium sp.]|nr:ABC transporter ATP-binding protein [Archangium sp.]
MTSPAIELQAVSKVYRLGLRNRKVRALTDVSLSVAPGEIVGLIGPNGAGKSTTIKIVLNLIQASVGNTFLFGVPVSEARARTSVGFVPENPAPYEYLTGIEYLRLQGSLAGLSSTATAERIKEVCELVELGAMSKTIVRGYSKGMIQRLVIAGALIGRPRLLILDEPTSGLDPLGRKLIRDAIIKQRENGTTVLFCTHIISDVEMLCDRFLLMVSGRLVREGKIGSVIEHKASTVEIVVEA